MLRLLSVFSLFLVMALNAASAAAKDLQIAPPVCAKNYGPAFIIKAPSAVWIRAKGSHPERFISAMADISGGFTMTQDREAAQYLLIAGTLSKNQFNQGTSQFSNIDQIDSPRTSPKGKMRYEYLEIHDAKTGQLAGRGFGRNNTAGLDFSNWNMQGPMGLALSTDDARLLSGSLVNAFFDFSQHPEKFDMEPQSAGGNSIAFAPPSGFGVHIYPRCACPCRARSPALSSPGPQNSCNHAVVCAAFRLG